MKSQFIEILWDTTLRIIVLSCTVLLSFNTDTWCQISRWHPLFAPPLPVTGEILANPLLVVPQQAVEGQHIAIANKGQAMIDRVTGWRVRSYVQEKPAVEKKSPRLGYRKKDSQHKDLH